MTCNTSLKEDHKSLTSPDKIKQLSDTSDVRKINDENVVELEKPAAGIVCQEGNIHERNLHETAIDQPTMIVSFQVPRKEVGGSEEVRSLERKSSAQKELNSVQRKKQIAEYNSLKLKEERQQRYRIRRGGELSFLYGKFDTHSATTSDGDDTPPLKRKKRVSFEF